MKFISRALFRDKYLATVIRDKANTSKSNVHALVTILNWAFGI